MANTVTLKRSSVPGKIPQSSDLAFGEVALNFTDGRLYFRNSNDQIEFFQTPQDQGVFDILASDLDLGLVTGASTQTLDLGSITDAANDNYNLGFVVNRGILFPDRFILPSSTVANLPNGIAGEMLLATDEIGGTVPVFFDGTNWRRLSDNQFVSSATDNYIENGYVTDGYV
jgi:hypothetical protein